MAEHETIADIIKWLRLPRDGENGYLAAWRDEIADRLEAAHRREMATAEKSSAVGNAAKLYEAVGYILKYADSAACRDHDEHTRHYIDQIRKWAQSALAAPPRNCDIVPIEAPKASDMFHRERPLHGYDYETHDWLLAPATEKEGGAK